jgi:hypothetical protein
MCCVTFTSTALQTLRSINLLCAVDLGASNHCVPWTFRSLITHGSQPECVAYSGNTKYLYNTNKVAGPVGLLSFTMDLKVSKNWTPWTLRSLSQSLTSRSLMSMVGFFWYLEQFPHIGRFTLCSPKNHKMSSNCTITSRGFSRSSFNLIRTTCRLCCH